MAKIIKNHNSVYANPSDTRDNWLAANPIIPDGVLVIESDTEKMKRGDGVSRYKDRPYISGSGGGGGDITEGLTAAGLCISVHDSAIQAIFGLPQGFLDTSYEDYQKAEINISWSDSGKESFRPSSIMAEAYSQPSSGSIGNGVVLNESNGWRNYIDLSMASDSGNGPFNILLDEVPGYKRSVNSSVSTDNPAPFPTIKTFNVTYTKL